MTNDPQGWQRMHRRLWLALAVLVAILAVLIVPPLVSVSRYKSQITHLMASSLGRPVRLSSVELHLLPRPGFVMTDLTVDEDPAYGAEPVLHAATVTASFRLFALWRGRLEISRVSVDDASLNLVRNAAGRWNLDPLFKTAAAKAQSGTAGNTRHPIPLPYLEATNSRINIKTGAEKLPYSLLNTDLSFWQAEPGDWRIRLRGEPARTDISVEGSDTGVVELEASAHQAPELRSMPLHLDLQWREAQLGQLTRLIIGTDPGWRGDLRGELHLDGTPEAAQIKTRLRATGVHRAEFAPAVPLDFDANCTFVYHYSAHALENLDCASPLGDGSVHIAGDLPGNGGEPRFSVELDKIPVQAGLDALRTVRSDFGPGLVAKGTASGKIAYAAIATESGTPANRNPRPHSAKAPPVSPGPLTGSFTVDGLELSGDSLSQPIQIPRFVFQPVPAAPGSSQPPALAATLPIPAGGVGPLTVLTHIALSGYRLGLHGQASIARARELARVAGLKDSAAFDALAGDPVSVDLSAEGPWQLPDKIPFSDLASTVASIAPALQHPTGHPAANPADPSTDSLSGSVTVRNANWKAGYLANHLEIVQATLHLDSGLYRWDPVVFSYGPVKGTASLTLPADCASAQPCLPQFQVQFGDLDAGTLQVAILGAHERGTLLSELIDRFHPSTSAPAWPQAEGTVKANSLVLGPVTLRQPSATVHILDTGIEITNLDAALLGGKMHGAGTLHTPATGQDKPAWSLTGQFQKLNPAEVGQLFGMHWTGGAFDADGKIDLSGFTASDLAASAKGTLHFEWPHGAVAAGQSPLPEPLARFDRWTADAEIANGAIALKQNQVVEGSRKHAVGGTLTLADPPKVTFTIPKETLAKKR
jgi:hypothetical protein